MFRKAFIFAALLLPIIVNNPLRPGMVNNPKGPAFDCYRSFHKQLEMTGIFAKDLGITTRCVFAANTINSLGEYYCQYPPIWTGIGQYAWENLDAQIDDILKVSPEARIVCMIDLNTPYWATRRFSGDSYDFISSFACDGKWFEETERWLEDFVAYAESKYGDKIFAYILSGGCTSEWYEYKRGYSSPLKDKTFGEWLMARGKQPAESAPTLRDLHKAVFENIVYDPATESDKIDYWTFHADVIADAVLRYAAKARSVIPAGKQIGAFFGYYLVSDRHTVSFGHMGYEKVLSSKDLDFFIAPASYSSRAMGEGSGSQTLFGTAMLNGKRLFHEVDHRPHGYFMGGSAYNDSIEDIAGNLREACFAIINHADMWWFDMWEHFYDDPSLREAIGKAHEVFERFKNDNSASVSEVLFLADPESMNGMNDETPFPWSLCEPFRNALSKMGMPIDCYSLSDVPVLDLSQYKVIALPATMTITKEKESLLKEYICKEGRTVIWCYAPGLSDGKSLDINRVKKWAGVQFGSHGVSVTKMGDWTAVYAKDPSAYSSEVLRKLCLEAGAHEYIEDTIPVFANERLICVHCKDGGKKTVHLRGKAKRVVDLFSGKTVAKNTSKFTLEFNSPDTRLFLID